MATEKQIKDLAYAIWEEEGRPEGKHLEHYFRAKQMLEELDPTDVIVLGPATPIIQLTAPPNRRKNSPRRTKR
jgi:hypothetical protein